MFGKLVVLSGLVAAFAFASDRPSCRDYCSGTTLYTHGYVMCYGSHDCVCEYNVVPNSPSCPVPDASEKRRTTKKSDWGG